MQAKPLTTPALASSAHATASMVGSTAGSTVSLNSVLDDPKRAIERLKQGDFQTRWDLAKQLPGLGAAVIEPLLAILQEEDSDWDLLWFVARILGALDPQVAVPALVTMLQNTHNPEVLGMATTSLAGCGAAAIAPLAELLQLESMRLSAVQGLAQIQQSAAIGPLLGVVEDADPQVRSAALEALSYFYHPEITDRLRAALTDPVAAVRQAAIVGLGLQATAGDPTKVEPALLVSWLEPHLRDFNLQVCTQAAIALGRIGNEAAVAALSEVLRSPQTPLSLRIDLARALAWIGTSIALTQLQQFIELDLSQLTVPHTSDLPSPMLLPIPTPSLPPLLEVANVAQEVIAVLGRVETPSAKHKATEILLDLLKTNSTLVQLPRTRQAIAHSLSQLNQPIALDPLIQLLADEDASVQFHAIAALKQFDSAAHDRLIGLSQQVDLDATLQAGITMALAEWRL